MFKDIIKHDENKYECGTYHVIYPYRDIDGIVNNICNYYNIERTTYVNSIPIDKYIKFEIYLVDMSPLCKWSLDAKRVPKYNDAKFKILWTILSQCHDTTQTLLDTRLNWLYAFDAELRKLISKQHDTLTQKYVPISNYIVNSSNKYIELLSQSKYYLWPDIQRQIVKDANYESK